MDYPLQTAPMVKAMSPLIAGALSNGLLLTDSTQGKDYVTSGDKYPVLNKRGLHVSPDMKFKWVK